MNKKYIVSVWVKSLDGDNDYDEEEVVDEIESKNNTPWIELFFNSEELVEYFENVGVWDEIKDNVGGNDYVWSNKYGVVYDFVDFYVLISEGDKYIETVKEYSKWDNERE